MTTAKTAALPYLDAFPTPSEDTWRAAVDKVLKGGDFERRLVARSADGIRIQPLYPPAASEARPLRQQLGRWHVAGRIDHPQAEAANELALADLEGGADMLSLAFAGAPAARSYGLVAHDVATLDLALDEVALDFIRLRIEPAPQGRINALMMAGLIEKRGLTGDSVSIDFGLDPIGVLASRGTLAAPWPEVGKRLAATIAALRDRGFKGSFVTVDSRPYHEAGASEGQELAAALATAVSYLRALEAQGMALDEARDALSFTLVADTDEYLTVAKLRAARLLWDRVQEACGLQPKPMQLHAETAWRSLTRRDPWVNMLRATIATFSAGVGGADSIAVLPYTQALGLPDGFARRVARNTQLVLIEEANLWRVADPAAGAGGFETLTAALCEKAWMLFQEIERQGDGGLRGILAALSNGTLQGDIAKQRQARQEAVATRREPLTGTSEYPNLRETTPAVLAVAPVAKAKPDGPPSEAASQPDLLIGEFARGASRSAGLIAPLDGINAEALPSIRLAEPFEALRERADAQSERPAVFLATLGPIAAFSARAGFARNLFEAGGIAAESGDGFATNGITDIDTLVAAYRASGTTLACLCGSDEAYAQEGAAAAEALKAAGATVWLAGKPGEFEEVLNRAGVTAFIQAGGDAAAALTRAQAIVI